MILWAAQALTYSTKDSKVAGGSYKKTGWERGKERWSVTGEVRVCQMLGQWHHDPYKILYGMTVKIRLAGNLPWFSSGSEYTRKSFQNQ